MLDRETVEFIFSVLLGIVGMGYCSYGRKKSPYYFCSGLGLLVFPYFIDGFWWLLGLGCLLMVLPYILDR